MDERYSTLPIRHYYAAHFLHSNILDGTLRNFSWDAQAYTHVCVITGAPSGLILVSFVWNMDNRFDYWLPTSRHSCIILQMPQINPLTFSWRYIAGSSSGVDIRLFAWYSPNYPVFEILLW